MKVSILADSINPQDCRLTTFLLHDFAKCLLAEINTHRMLSRNAASVRAIPVAKVIEQVQTAPFVPMFTGNQPGMQGAALSPNKQAVALKLWLSARDQAVEMAAVLREEGIHKQNANRLLEPFMTVPVIVSGTEWDNFFHLRCSPEAQPEFREFAVEMQRLRSESVPRKLEPGQWHIPFLDQGVSAASPSALKIAVARCARVSYTTHYGTHDMQADIKLHDRLLESGHGSPFEHIAMALDDQAMHKNFKGFEQYRTVAELQKTLDSAEALISGL